MSSTDASDVCAFWYCRYCTHKSHTHTPLCNAHSTLFKPAEKEGGNIVHERLEKGDIQIF